MKKTLAKIVMPPRWDLFVFLLLALTIRLVLVALYPHYAIDDAAITMRYAQNLIRGQGFVYNQGERVLGTTTPIYTLVLSGLGLLFGDFFLPTGILNSLIDVGSLTIVYLLFARRGQTRLGVVASGLIGSYMPLLQMPMWRMETSLYVFFILLTVLAISEGKWHLGAISSGILMLIRPDGAIVAAVFVLCYLLVKRSFPVTPMLTMLAVALPWFLFALVYFGSPIPQSVYAKSIIYTQQAIVEQSASFIRILAIGGQYSAGHRLLMLPFVLIGLINAFVDRRWLIPLSLWFVVYVLFYEVSGIYLFHWYLAPAYVPLLIFFVSGGDRFVKWCLKYAETLRRFEMPLYSLLVSGVIVIGIVSGYMVSKRLERESEYFSAPILIAQWLRDHTPPDVKVCADTIGFLGLYSDRKILDVVGLVSPEVISLHEEYLDFYEAYVSIVERYEPDYCMIRDTELRRIPRAARDRFEHYYVVVLKYGEFNLYARKD
jgi:hypothetical protein